jgi:thymidylate synthase (FAD)
MKPELVKLIWITPDAEKVILYIARVSSDQSNESTGLLKYLIRNKHWSPFEMASMCVEINTTRAISQQIIRHRSFSFQEFSQRYAAIDVIDLPELRMQHESNRQSSAEVTHEFDYATSEAILKIQSHYEWLLEQGVSKETARMVLPMCSPTKLYMAGTIRSWIHYMELRLDREHTQKEHVLIAEEIEQIIARELPTVYQAFGEIRLEA